LLARADSHKKIHANKEYISNSQIEASLDLELNPAVVHRLRSAYLTYYYRDSSGQFGKSHDLQVPTPEEPIHLIDRKLKFFTCPTGRETGLNGWASHSFEAANAFPDRDAKEEEPEEDTRALAMWNDSTEVVPLMHNFMSLSLILH